MRTRLVLLLVAGAACTGAAPGAAVQRTVEHTHSCDDGVVVQVVRVDDSVGLVPEARTTRALEVTLDGGPARAIGEGAGRLPMWMHEAERPAWRIEGDTADYGIVLLDPATFPEADAARAEACLIAHRAAWMPQHWGAGGPKGLAVVRGAEADLTVRFSGEGGRSLLLDTGSEGEGVLFAEQASTDGTTSSRAGEVRREADGRTRVVVYEAMDTSAYKDPKGRDIGAYYGVTVEVVPWDKLDAPSETAAP